MPSPTIPIPTPQGTVQAESQEAEFCIVHENLNVYDTATPGFRVRVRFMVTGIRFAKNPDGTLIRNDRGEPIVAVDFHQHISTLER